MKVTASIKRYYYFSNHFENHLYCFLLITSKYVLFFEISIHKILVLIYSISYYNNEIHAEVEYYPKNIHFNIIYILALNVVFR